MHVRQRAAYVSRARVIKALAHPARLMIVDELQGGPRCVCDLRAKVGSDISTVSKHLSVLRNAGIVQDDKRGVQVFYRLQCPCVTAFLKCIASMVRTAAATHLQGLEAASARWPGTPPKPGRRRLNQAETFPLS